MAREQVVLITGCGSGIGRALATDFAFRGFKVYATARRPESLEGLSTPGIETMILDVNDPKSIAAARDKIYANSFMVDILINNAGYGQMGPALDIPLDRVRGQFETNVVAPLALIQAFAPRMMDRRRGLIINISSISGTMATPFAGVYCASKAALSRLSDSLRMELAPFGVNVMIVEPGGVQSKFGKNAALGVAMAPESYYKPLEAAIQDRANASQQGAHMAEEVAARIADAALQKKPPRTLACGRGGRLYPAMRRWLPLGALDGILSRRFGLGSLKPG